MSGTLREKQERIVEAVRRGLEGMRAVEFIQQSGYAMNPAGIARSLKTMGGRGRVLQMIDEGKSNREIMEEMFSGEEASRLVPVPPQQVELFKSGKPVEESQFPGTTDQFETTRIALRVPSDLYEAIKFAARAEGKSRQDLIVEVLTSALSQMPRTWPPEEA